MAPRRIIADSDDEDSGNEPLSPLGREIEPPRPEPLSPQHRPSSLDVPSDHNHISDITDPSFFADVYGEQQNRALQQSHLIERIVRQSQKASASSGEVSPPANARGRKSNPSSEGDTLSLVALNGLGDNGLPEFTTPRKSTGGEWEVPSSPADVPSRSVRRSSERKEKTYGKQRKSQSKSPVKILAVEDDLALPSEGSARDRTLESSPPPAMETKKASLHESVIPENNNFYIAPSNLTTMQKLEYQKVNVLQNGYAGLLPGTLSNQKSSCATTIAYPTPSRYASSGPPLPWERPATATQEDNSHGVIDITSSPDVIGPGYSRSPKRKLDTLQTEDNLDDPVKSPSKPPSAKRDKKKSRISEDADELGQDEAWDSDASDIHRENYKPRPSRRRAKATTIIEDETFREDPNTTVYEGNPDEPIGTEVISDAPGIPTIDDMKADQPEPKAAAQPKRRGRKKKQPVTEDTPQDILDNSNPAIIEEPTRLETALQTVVPSEKPKKKRGRPRKSNPAKVEQAVSTEIPTNLESNGTSTQPDEPASESPKQDAAEHKPKKRKLGPEESASVNDQAANDDTLPLKDVDSNTRGPPKTLSSGAPPAAKAAGERSARESTPGKPEAKNTPSSTPGSKVPYRVGLSKRSRIAPLLKIIRK